MTKKINNWSSVRLGDILTYVDQRVELEDLTEYITITVKRRHGGLVERERLTGHQIKTKKQFRLVPGSFIISRIQCWHQAYAIVPNDVPKNMIASINYDQFTISSSVDPRFFWWFSHSPAFTETVRSSAFGVVIEKMVFKRDAWLQKSIPLPALDEQRRIVQKIENLASKIEEAQRLRQKSAGSLDTVLGSAAQTLFSRFKGSFAPLGKAVNSMRNGLSRRPTGVEDGPVVLRLLDVSSGTIDLRSPRRGSLSETELKAYRLTPGDLLFIRVNGSLDLIGRSIIFRGAEETVCFNDHLIRVRVDTDQLDPKYARLMANSPPARRYMMNTAITTAGQNTINQGMLSDLHIPFPPLDEQRHIVAYLDELQAKVDSLNKLQEKSSTELDALMPSILSKAFKGEL